MRSFSFDITRATLMKIAIGLLFVIGVLAVGKFLGYGSSYEFMDHDDHDDEEEGEEESTNEESPSATYSDSDVDDEPIEPFTNYSRL